MANDREVRLTPAAVEALEEMLGERRREITAYAVDHARGDQVTAVDVMNAFYRTAESRNMPSSTPIEGDGLRMAPFALLTVTCVLLAVTVFAGVALLIQEDSITPKPQTLVIAVAGIAALISGAAAGLFLFSVRRRSLSISTKALLRSDVGSFELPDIDMDLSERGNFLNTWTALESSLRSLSGRVLTLSGPDERPFGAVVDTLIHDKVLSADAEYRIKRLLRARNEAAHREFPRLDADEIGRDIKLIMQEVSDASRRH